jgi:hypothetical protein
MSIGRYLDLLKVLHQGFSCLTMPHQVANLFTEEVGAAEKIAYHHLSVLGATSLPKAVVFSYAIAMVVSTG